MDLHILLGPQALEKIISELVDYCNSYIVIFTDSNINFFLPEVQLLLGFLEWKFSLRMINSRNYHTTKGGTTIDATFAKTRKYRTKIFCIIL